MWARPGRIAAAAAAGLVLAIHGHAFWEVAAHHGSPAGGTRWLGVTVSVATLATIGALLVGTRPSSGEGAEG